MRKPIGNRAGLRRPAAVALMLATLLWATDKGPDAGNYTATDNTVYSFADPAGGGGSPSVLGGTDDGVALLTLPFAFQFYGQSYTMACASVNGLFYFVTSADTCNPLGPLQGDFANTDLTAAAAPGDLPAVAPLWSDLSFTAPGAGVFYQAVGTAPNRKFIIEWYNAVPSGSPNPVTFEAVLSEGSNNILFQYQTVDLGAGNPASKGALATIGIRDGGGNTNNRQIQWSYNAAVAANNGAILFNAPSSTATSVNTIATVPPGVNVTIDGVATPTPKVVSWVPGSSHTLSVVTPQTNGGARTTLTSWSNSQTNAQITVQAPVVGTTFSATFATQYQLTTSANPSNEGSVSGAAFYDAGAVAVVRATPQPTFSLTGFSGDLTGTANPQNLTMNGPKNVIANFGASFSPCDVTQDGITNVDDVQRMISEALGIITPTHDLNLSGSVNVVDVQIALNAALTLGCTAQ